MTVGGATDGGVVPVAHRLRVTAGQVAAAVVTYNRVEVLDRSLGALFAQAPPPGAVIVVDNASTDGTAAAVRERFPSVVYLQMPENTGAAGGFAAAMRIASSLGYDWTWVFNDDDVPDRHALARMLGVLEGRPGRLGVLGCARRDASGRNFTIGGTWRHRLRDVAYEETMRDLVQVDVVAFSGSLVANDMVVDIGLPRADYFMMMEELEYCLRARRAGWAVGVLPEQLVTSMTLGSPGGSSPAWRAYYQTRNHLLMARERRSLAEAYWWATRTAKLTAAALVSGRGGLGRARMRAKGAWDGLRGVTGRTVLPRG